MRGGPVSQSGVECCGTRVLPAHYKCFGGKNFNVAVTITIFCNIELYTFYKAFNTCLLID